jgi:murein DD-endopeptidase MepM/ murein hydrolase activator NlpD
MLLAVLFAVIFASVCAASDAFVLLDTNVVKEGGILKVKIFCDKPIKACDIDFNGEKFTAFFKQFDIKQNQYIFNSIIPVKLGTKGRKDLSIKYMLQDDSEHSEKEKIVVKLMKDRPVEIDSKGTLNDDTESGLVTEGKIIYSLQTPVTAVKYDFPFIMPVDAQISGGFGDARVYDGGRGKWRHKGIDLAAKKNTPVHADNNGIVATASSTKAYGNIVILDHGAGIYSLFFHMRKLFVKKGANVSKGDIIGTVGDSGISTGPHLHWQICVFKTPVNPKDFLTDF